MSKKKLADFLKQLAQDPALMERYKKNPRPVMDEFGVSAEHQDMVIKGNDADLQKALDGNPDNLKTTSIRNFK